jgi:hypothetical protein
MNSLMQRFTIDGDDILEGHLASVCGGVIDGVSALLPRSRLEAIVLGGGYGRGQGGVLRTNSGDRPYNDLEFYVFLRGAAWSNARRFDGDLQTLGEQLSLDAGVHVEFKIDSLTGLRRRPISMFSHDLVARHRVLLGNCKTFHGCQHHLDPTTLPAAEATRLLLNRCTGLLLAKTMLAENASLNEEHADFIGRNLAKLRLALGDALLTAFGQYHWSCLERHKRLRAIQPPVLPPEFEKIRRHHTGGVAFKLHPSRQESSRESFDLELRELSGMAFQVWLWLENRRLGRAFSGPRDYALSPLEKCCGTNKWRNYLLNLRAFGPKALLGTHRNRYPRERLFNTLPLLLWYEPVANEPEVLRRVQEQLMTKARDWSGWLAAYKQLWPAYG